MRQLTKTLSIISTITLAFAASQTLAHVTMNPNQSVAGSYFNGKIRVPHGCGEQPTTSVVVTIPDGILSVKPENIAGWKIDIHMKKLEQPVKYHGKDLLEVIDTITWSGGNLPNAHYKDFGLNIKLPDQVGRLFFKTTQICAEGSTIWDGEFNTPEQRKQVKKPSPYVDLVSGEHMNH